ncbi:hypothetical protein FHW84_002505 [Dyella sp. SG562]|uniref:hypothetical protein n=1 Tax=Dyella sp. SG562 TaxID=2587017 RepID=UPI0014246BAE|nr:hypothetical protein [Dyella sp. SG562]NII73932.1 hypothetical protein [Dyella sp. SG562]
MTVHISNARWEALMNDASVYLTQEEMDAGWHFCHRDWDGLLVGPSMLEWDSCTCGITPKEAT